MASDEFVKREREAARTLRKSSWWKNRVANGAKCHYCERELTESETTMDHLVAISDGGRSTKNNIVVSCKSCNTRKRDMSVVDWINYLEAQKSKDDV